MRSGSSGPSSGENRVNRGGSWNNDARNCRSANRNRNDPGNRNNNLGFRLASTIRGIVPSASSGASPCEAEQDPSRRGWYPGFVSGEGPGGAFLPCLTRALRNGSYWRSRGGMKAGMPVLQDRWFIHIDITNVNMYIIGHDHQRLGKDPAPSRRHV